MELKRTPDDFIVEEILPERFTEKLRDPNDPATYLIVEVRKRDLDHFTMIERLARIFRCKDNEIGYAGIKDRKATTTQHISILNTKRTRSLLKEEYTRGQISLRILAGSDERLNLGMLTANRFTITAHNLTAQERSSIEYAHEQMPFPNYYGEQRFARHNIHIAYAFLTRDFKRAAHLLDIRSENPTNDVLALPRKQRMLLLSAMQSAIFNYELATHIYQHTEQTPPTLDGLDPDGILDHLDAISRNPPYPTAPFFVEGALPLLALGAQPTPIGEHILQKLGISLRDFAIRQMPDVLFEPAERMMFATMHIHEKTLENDAARVRFTLPRGAYATCAMRQLTNDRSVP